MIACTCSACSAVDPLKEWTEVKLLGKGGFGEVFLYKNVNTGEQQAVKKVSFDSINQQVPSHYSKTFYQTPLQKSSVGTSNCQQRISFLCLYIQVATMV